MTDPTLAALTDWMHRFAVLVSGHRDELTALDSAIGDADHGANMDRGMTAAWEKVQANAPATLDALGKIVGMTLVSTVGGASGPLYGTFFLRFGVAAGAVETLDTAGLAAALRAGLLGVEQRGKAERGDKTMLDAMIPAVEAFEAASGSGASAAARAAADAAAAGRDATESLIARKGRASYLGDRSAGHLDPGAVSTAYLFAALADALA